MCENNNPVTYTGYDEWTGRVFKTSVALLNQAERDLNYLIAENGSASMNDLHDLLGLAPTFLADKVGWSGEQPRVQLTPRPILLDGIGPAVTFDLRPEPANDISALA